MAMRRIVGLAAIAALAMTSPAEARHHRARIAPMPDPVAYMRVVIARYWREAPCGGQYLIAPGNDSTGETDNILAWSLWKGPNGPQDDTSSHRLFTDCTIILDSSSPLWESWAAEYAVWPVTCITLLHEAGHLLGYQHSTDPTNVMYPHTSFENIPRVCDTAPDGTTWNVVKDRVTGRAARPNPWTVALA